MKALKLLVIIFFIFGCNNTTTESPQPTCAKTSACGCSNKTKANCKSPCCKWIVGKGCDCK